MAQRRGGAVSPPDGGWGWVIVGSCFMVTVCTRAVTRCISLFFVEFQVNFNTDYAATAWIHSLVDCTTMLCAPLGSLLGNRWSCRGVVMLGGLLSSVGLLLSSFSSTLETLYLTMGVLTGLGFSLCYTPAVSMVGVYFRRRAALAYGVAMAGGGIGTFVLAPAVQLLIERYSWRGALLVLSGLVANLCVCGALLRPITTRRGEEEAGPDGEGAESAGEEKPGSVSPGDAEQAGHLPGQSDDSFPSLPSGSPAPRPRRRRCFLSPEDYSFLSREDYSFLLRPDFLSLGASFLLLAAGCSPPVVYLVPYARSAGVPQHHAAVLMATLGALDIVGNVTFGWLTDRSCVRRRRLACYVVAVAMEGACVLLLPLLSSLPMLLPFAVLYGYFDGAYVALIPVVTGDAVGTPHLSSALGVVYFLHAVPYLLSPPIGGWLVDVTGSYTSTFLLSGAALLASAAVLAAAAGARRCRRDDRPLPLRPPDQSRPTTVPEEALDPAAIRGIDQSDPSTSRADEGCDWPGVTGSGLRLAG